MTRASGRLLREHNRSPTTPQRLPPRRSGIVRSPDKKTGAIG
ncbi:DNA-binding protein, partial [Salmonella enterica subsp. enterica serovar Cerro]